MSARSMSISSDSPQVGLKEHISGKRSCSNLFGITDFYDPECRGYVLMGASRGFAVITGALYLSIAINNIAGRLSCNGDIDFGVLSIKSTNVIATITYTEGIVTAIISPIFGAIVDLSSYRKTIYIAIQAIWASMSLLHVLFLFMPESTDSLMGLMITMVLQAVFYELSYVVHFSYLPEVGKGNDHLVTAVSSKYYLLLNAIQFLAIVLVSGASFALETEAKFNAILASFLVFAFCAVFSILSLRMIGSHPPARALIEGETRNPCFGGFQKSFRTLRTVYNKYPQVLIFLVGFMTLMSTVAAMVALATTYFGEQLGLDDMSTQIVVLFSLVVSIPGAAIGNLLKERLPIKRVIQLVALIWIFGTVATPIIINGREMTDLEVAEYIKTEEYNNSLLTCDGEGGTIPRTYDAFEFYLSFFFAGVWGIGIGMSYPVCASMYSMIIPGGDEAEFFGLRTFLLKLCSFIPPLLFNFVNEKTNKLDTAFLTLSPFFFIAFVAFSLVNMDKAKKDVEETIHLRRVKRKSGVFIYDALEGTLLSDEDNKDEEDLEAEAPENATNAQVVPAKVDL